MIPQIIHYTWFSGEQMPQQITECIASWKKYLPNYELRKWDLEAVKDIDVPFLKEALMAKKWAYAADFVRVYAVYHYGGIYLDTDVMLYHSLDSYLDNVAFIGKENSIHFEGRQSFQYLSSHCFGAEKGHPFIKNCMDYYRDRHFVISKNDRLPVSLRYNMVLMPYIQAEIAKCYGYDSSPRIQTVQNCKEGLTIYPSEVFDPETVLSSSVCKHLALGGWREKKSSEPEYSLRYKIEWRIVALIQKIVSLFDYKLVKIQ